MQLDAVDQRVWMRRVLVLGLGGGEGGAPVAAHRRQRDVPVSVGAEPVMFRPCGLGQVPAAAAAAPLLPQGEGEHPPALVVVPLHLYRGDRADEPALLVVFVRGDLLGFPTV